MKQSDGSREYQFGDQPPAAAILTQGNPPKGSPITVLMAGMARSGTSATAALIDGMGVAMDDSYDGHFERLYFKNHMRLDMLERMDADIDRLNKKYSDRPWGTQLWLNPFGVYYMVMRCRNPVLVLTFRDYVAILARWNSIEFAGPDQDTRINRARREMDAIISLFCYSLCPTVGVSFEKLRKNPAQVYDEIATFFKLEGGDKAEAVARINPNSGYLIQLPPENYDYEKLGVNDD